jgi:tRNA dimethylallyltransferase
LALALAEEFRGTVINADAMQCYRDLRILTARPDAAAEARAPHRLYGYLDAASRGSAGDWCRRARAEIAAAAAERRPPIVVGGSGLYLRALTRGLAPIPEIPERVFAAAQADHRALGGDRFRERLQRLDPAAAEELARGDTQRLVRAYAVALHTGRPLTQWRAEPHHAPIFRFATILLLPPRAELYAACDTRFRSMLEAGALDEAAALAARRLDPGLPALKAAGLRELQQHLAGGLALEAAVVAAQQATRRYAKRQITWFRHQSSPDLVVPGQFSERILPAIRHFINHSYLTGGGFAD